MEHVEALTSQERTDPSDEGRHDLQFADQWPSAAKQLSGQASRVTAEVWHPVDRRVRRSWIVGLVQRASQDRRPETDLLLRAGDVATPQAVTVENGPRMIEHVEDPKRHADAGRQRRSAEMTDRDRLT
jgi:hypothetical protein